MRDAGHTRLTLAAAFAALVVAAVVAQDVVKPVTPATPAKPAGLQVLWRRTPMPVAGPATLVVGPKALFLSSSETGLGAYATDDGRTLWSSSLVSDLAAVVVGPQVAVVSGGAIHMLAQDSGQEAWRADADSTTSALFALDARLGAVAGTELRTWSADGTAGWRTTLPGTPTTRVAVQNGTAFVGIDPPALVALDATTGAIRWQVALGARPLKLTAADDRVFLAASNATLYAYRVAPEPKPAWAPYRLVRAIGEPLVDGERIYYALLDNSVRGFDRRGGTQRWSKVMTPRPSAGPVRFGTNLAVALSNGTVVELSARDGQVVAPSEPVNSASERLQAVVASQQGDRVFTFTIAGNNVRTLSAWGHPAEQR